MTGVQQNPFFLKLIDLAGSRYTHCPNSTGRRVQDDAVGFLSGLGTKSQSEFRNRGARFYLLLGTRNSVGGENHGLSKCPKLLVGARSFCVDMDCSSCYPSLGLLCILIPNPLCRLWLLLCNIMAVEFLADVKIHAAI